jgi:ligand-binding sensor domain-containing protein
MRLLTVILLLLGVNSLVMADMDVQVQTYTINDGLSHPHSFQAFQDSRDFIWLATANGLNFFDGRRFHLRLPWAQGKPWQSRIICEDSRGFLWIRLIDNSGVIRYKLVNVRTGSVYLPEAIYAQTIPKDIVHVAAGAKGLLWISDSQGNIWKRTPEGLLSKVYHTDEGPLDFCLDRYDGEVLWLLDHEPSMTNHHQLSAIDIRGKKLVQRQFITLEAWHAGIGDTLVYYKGMQQFRLSPNGGYRRVILESLAADDEITLMPSSVSYDSGQRRVWFNYYGKLRLYGDQGEMITLSSKNGLKGGLSMYSAGNQSLWISSFSGLIRVSTQVRRFKRLLWLAPEQDGQPFEQACRGAATLSDGRIVLASGKGLWLHDPTRWQTILLQTKYSYYPVVRDPYERGL